MNLSAMKDGKIATIIKVTGAGISRSYLAEPGVSEGAQTKVAGHVPLGVSVHVFAPN